MDEEIRKKLLKIFEPAIDSAWTESIEHPNPLSFFEDQIQWELGYYQRRLSQVLYEIDLYQMGATTKAKREELDRLIPEIIKQDCLSQITYKVRVRSEDMDGTGISLNAASFTMGGLGSNIGRHMDKVSRFRPVEMLNGRVVYSSSSLHKYGPLAGKSAARLGKGLRVGGNLLGAGGVLYTSYQMYTGQISLEKGFTDIGFGVISFAGPLGLGISLIYFGIDTFYPGGIKGFVHDHAKQQADFYRATGWSMRSLMH